MATFTLDLGTSAAKALMDKDWAQLGRLQPANKRSKDPSRVQGARTRATRTPVPSPAPPEQ